ncbi:MAG: helix-turn-helix domain-containing protein [Acetatifactor sp.]
MDGLPSRLIQIRKERHLTQSEVAEKLNVSFQAVSLWERGETVPDTEKIVELAKLYGVSCDFLLRGEKESTPIHFELPLTGRLFDEEHMYTYVKTYAALNGLTQTLKALPYARELHKGQVRKGMEKIPYFNHPLVVACHALSLGLDNDDIIATALLHDVCEDCGVTPEELPVGDSVKEAVWLLTKDSTKTKEEYFDSIGKNEAATLVKLLDRCNNVSGMSGCFSESKLIRYISETEKWVYPLLQIAKSEYLQYSNQVFLIKYHMTSVINSLKFQLLKHSCGGTIKSDV